MSGVAREVRDALKPRTEEEIRENAKKKVVHEQMVGAGESTSESSGLRVYYCRGCSGLAFILSCDLTSRPKRKTDGSWVVKEAKFLKTVKMEQGDVKRIRRAKGIEKQYRYHCAECGMFLAYRPAHWETPTKFLYVLADMVTEDAGAVSAQLMMNKPIPGCVRGLPGKPNSTRLMVEVKGGGDEDTVLEVTKERALVSVTANKSDESAMNSGLLRFLSVMLDVPDNKVMMEFEGGHLAVIMDGKAPQEVANMLHSVMEGGKEEDVFNLDTRRFQDNPPHSGAGRGFR